MKIGRKKINKKKPEAPRQPIPSGIMKLLQAMGKISMPKLRASRYTRHQGPRECARRVRQMQQNALPKSIRAGTIKRLMKTTSP